jgi:gamma-glutamylcyclotransferase
LPACNNGGMRLHYFAYGSNMSLPRLAARAPSAQLVGVARLERHALRFHKPGSRDGTGKCDAFETGDPADAVAGALYSMLASDLPRLDAAEGAGHGYERRQVSVTTASGATVLAETYIATAKADGLRPLDWYLEHVLRGARELGLPPAYVAAIEAVAADADADAGRRERELSIYR